MNHRLIPLSALLFVVLLTGCSGNEEEDNKISQEPQTPYGVKEGKAQEGLEDFVSNIESEMLVLRDEMDRIQVRINSSNEQLKDDVDVKWSEVKEKRQELEFRLDELVTENNENQQKLKAEIRKQLQDYRESLRELKNTLGMDEQKEFKGTNKNI